MADENVEFRVVSTPRMTQTVQMVLRAMLYHKGEPLYAAEIRDLTGIDSGVMSPILTRLEAFGWIKCEWRENPTEGRPRRKYCWLVEEKVEDIRSALEHAARAFQGFGGELHRGELQRVVLNRMENGDLLLDGLRVTEQQAVEYVRGFSSLSMEIPGQSLADKLTRYLQNEIQDHQADPQDPLLQWYVDVDCIDCDAKEFWKAVQAALEKFYDTSPALTTEVPVIDTEETPSDSSQG